MRKDILSLLLLLMIFITGCNAQQPSDNNKTNGTIVVLETNQGNIELELFPDIAPKAVKNFVELSKKGYYNVVITYKIHGLPNNEVLLKYEIQENKKVYITKIEILGNKAFDDGDIKKIMLTGEKSLFSWITDSGYLDMKKLEFDTHRITAFYHNHGFIFRVVYVFSNNSYKFCGCPDFFTGARFNVHQLFL